MTELTSDQRSDAHKLVEEQRSKLGLVPAWSYSRLKSFEECPYKVYISSVKKIQEPQGEAAARGEAVHKDGELFIIGKTENLTKDYAHFDADMRRAKQMFANGKAEVEGEWGFTIDWQPTGWMAGDCWARIKLDLLAFESETSALVVDFKTGKKIGNEIAHKQQGLLYAIGTFMRFPDIEFVTCEFWYLDQKEKMKTSYTRAEALKWLPAFTRRGMLLTTCTDWKPTPSPSSCRWCTYGKGENPECRFAVT